MALLRTNKHQWWDPGFRPVCGRCGAPKPRADEQPTPCVGRVMLPPDEVDARKGQAFLNLLIQWSWMRIANGGDRFDPAHIRALRIHLEARLSPLGRDRYHDALRQVNEDAKATYQAVPADTDPREHALAVCVAILALIGIALPPDDQAALTATAVLQEAQDAGSDWPRVREGQLSGLSDRMLSEARRRGYFAKPAPGLAVLIH